jgi:hypothetical protein
MSFERYRKTVNVVNEEFQKALKQENYEKCGKIKGYINLIKEEKYIEFMEKTEGYFGEDLQFSDVYDSMESFFIEDLNRSIKMYYDEKWEMPSNFKQVFDYFERNHNGILNSKELLKLSKEDLEEKGLDTYDFDFVVKHLIKMINKCKLIKTKAT